MLWYFSQFSTLCDVFLSQSSQCWQDWRSFVYAKPSMNEKNWWKTFHCSRLFALDALLSPLHHCLLIVFSPFNNEIALDLSGWDVIEMNEEKEERLDEEMRVTLMGLSSWLNYFNSLTLTLEISGELMIVSLECEYFGCFAVIVTNQQIWTTSDKHVADTSSLHLSSFVKRRLSSLVIQYVDNGVGCKCDQKFHHILMSTTWRMMKCCPAHRINREQWIALEMELFQLNGREMRWEKNGTCERTPAHKIQYRTKWVSL